MKHFKRILLMLCALMLTLSLFVSCVNVGNEGSDTNVTKDGNESINPADTTDAQTTGGASDKKDPPVIEEDKPIVIQKEGAAEILAEDIIVGRVDADAARNYQGWPTVCVDENDTLYAVCSGNRLEHVDPFGETWMYKSTDGGVTWSGPVTVSGGDGRYLDNRDAGITYLGNGKMVLTYFRLATYNYYEKAHYDKPADSNLKWQEILTEYNKAGKIDVTVDDIIAKWETLPALEQEGGAFVRISYDYGETWSEEYAAPVSTPHGPIVLTKQFHLSDGKKIYKTLQPGTLVYVGRACYIDQYQARANDATRYKSNSCYAVYSTDDGKNWRSLIEIPDALNGEVLREPHAVQLQNGNIFMSFRTNNSINTEFEIYTNTLYSGTADTPHKLGVARATAVGGVQTNLKVLQGGALLMTYGWRYYPALGERARLSYDFGQTWEDEIVLSTIDNPQASHNEVGNPSTVQLSDGTLVTVYYQPSGNDVHSSILCTRWKFGELSTTGEG